MMDTTYPPEIRSVVVVGLGLIGGSLARDLAARGVRVFAWDHDAGATDTAMRQGIAKPASGDEPVDAILLAVPVLTAPDLLTRVVRRMGPGMESVRLIMDAGSTKRSIIRRAEALGIGGRFVGAHPLAGDHRSGWTASREGLFQDARVFLCPTSSTEPESLQLARSLWTGVGARPEVMDTEAHDARLAWTSHLPQMVSSALAGALAGQGIERAELGPGGRDVTRLAGSDPAMWTDIARDNADQLVPALDAMLNHLRALRFAISDGQYARVHDLLAQARPRDASPAD